MDEVSYKKALENLYQTDTGHITAPAGADVGGDIREASRHAAAARFCHLTPELQKNGRHRCDGENAAIRGSPLS